MPLTKNSPSPPPSPPFPFRSSPDPSPRTPKPIFLIANPRLEIKLTHRKSSPIKISNREEIAFFYLVLKGAKASSIQIRREKRRPRTRPLAPKNFSRSNPCARLSQAVQQQIKFSATTAHRWNFGLCATIPREPRQARKGATVAGQLRVPRITRSSSLLLSQVREPQDVVRVPDEVGGLPSMDDKR